MNRNNRGLAPILHPGATGRYDVYQQHTERSIPLVLLEPTTTQTLADASQARSTHVRDGVVTVTDGPFLEAKEALAGYCIVDVATPERSEEIAARWPDAQGWGMEIRALKHGAGKEG